MLLCKNFRRRHDAGLEPVSDSYQCSEYSHHGLTAAHITLKKAVHLMTALHIIPDLSDHPLLSSGQREGESVVA